MSLLLILALLGVAGAVFAVVRSRPSGSSSDAADSSANDSSSVHLPLPERALRIHFAELGLDEEMDFMRRLSPEMSEWMGLLVAGNADEALSRAGAVHAARPGHRAATCFLMRAHLAARDNAGAARVAKAYFDAVGSSDCQSSLQTWHQLRAMNVFPEGEAARDVLGLVIESNFPGSEGTQAVPTLLAVYLDGGSMLHRGRRMVPGNGPDTRPEVKAAAKELVVEAAKVELPESAPRPSAPVEGYKMRFTFLTPGGPRVLEAEMEAMTTNPSHPLAMLLLTATQLVAKKSDVLP